MDKIIDEKNYYEKVSFRTTGLGLGRLAAKCEAQ